MSRKAADAPAQPHGTALRPRNAGVRKLRRVSLCRKWYYKGEKAIRGCPRVFETGKSVGKTVKGVIENEANPFKVDNLWKNSEKIKGVELV